MSKVVVLGYDVWEELFNGEDAVGKKIKIKKETFRVIGVAEERGVQGLDNQDAQVYIPLGTAQKLIFGINYLHAIGAKVRSEKDVPYVVSQIEDIMMDQHKIEKKEESDFTVYTTAQAIESLTNITNALKFFLSAIAAISLLVGGVGIMNIMLVAINERTREIGLRKALGATPANVQRQFLIESAIITMLGGVIGIIFGTIFSGLVAVVANYLGYAWKFSVTFGSIFLGVGVSAGVGILFGWYPSKKASDLEPVKALHHE
jgi:putative ABC transport system permease protein